MRITLNSFSRFLSADSRCFKGKNFKQAPISIGKPVFTEGEIRSILSAMETAALEDRQEAIFRARLRGR